MTHHSLLITHHLTVGYGKRAVVANIDAELYAGELVCLIGPNGAGKSTLLRTLAGMQSPLEGNVLLLGSDVAKMDAQERAKRLSVVLTERVNVGHLTAFALVALGRHPHTDWTGKLTPHDEDVVRKSLQAVGAEAFAERDINELSDGERQKVLIARALAQEPAVMLLDEPTAYLDLPRRVEIMRTLRELAHKTGRALLLSTHDLDLALRSADRVWLLPMSGVMQTGAPEDLVLNGAFAAAFHSEGVDFDMHSGAFRVDSQPQGQIQLIGEGISAIWTARALERAGFQVTDAPATLRVEIFDERQWNLHRGGTAETYDTLYTLVKALP